MPTYNPILAGSMIKFQYVNPDIPAGNTIASALIGNTKTAFASTTTIPESTAIIGGIAQIMGAGVINSGITALSLTISIEMAGIVVATAVQAVSINLTNTGWKIDIRATILGNGTVEVQGMCNLGTSVLPIKNTAPFAMSTAGGVPVTISATWGTLALGGSITLRQLIVQVS